MSENNKNQMKIRSRPIAITDLETTGVDPAVHEIVEIGLVLIDQSTFKILDTLDVKVKPKHLEVATEFALKLNGYNEADWCDALSLEEAVALYIAKTKDAIFCASPVTFDWSFIEAAFKKTKLAHEMDYHRLDIFSMAWQTLRHTDLEKFNGDALMKFFGLEPEPPVHRAINGAMKDYEIFTKLMEYRIECPRVYW